MKDTIDRIIEVLKKSNHTSVFTGAGISVESGIPPFRGENGLWSKYNPIFLELDYFYSNPLESWKVIKEIFYDFFGIAKPNAAHIAIAELEVKGIVNSVITQNIDNLHQEAGSKVVYEFHGNSHSLICTSCKATFGLSEISLDKLPPGCLKCNSLLKPDFIFFGEGIPELAYSKSIEEANIADAFIVIGTTGEIMPACSIPRLAKQNGATIIEINPDKSTYTDSITDIYLEQKAGEAMTKVLERL